MLNKNYIEINKSKLQSFASVFFFLLFTEQLVNPQSFQICHWPLLGTLVVKGKLEKYYQYLSCSLLKT